MLNKPPYIPKPLPKGKTKKLFIVKKLIDIKPRITILEYNIDLSCLNVTAFENNKKINKEINIRYACYINHA